MLLQLYQWKKEHIAKNVILSNKISTQLIWNDIFPLSYILVSINSLSVLIPKPHSLSLPFIFSLWLSPPTATHKAIHSKAFLVQPQQSPEASIRSDHAAWD